AQLLRDLVKTLRRVRLFPMLGNPAAVSSYALCRLRRRPSTTRPGVLTDVRLLPTQGLPTSGYLVTIGKRFGTIRGVMIGTLTIVRVRMTRRRLTRHRLSDDTLRYLQQPVLLRRAAVTARRRLFGNVLGDDKRLRMLGNGGAMHTDEFA